MFAINDYIRNFRNFDEEDPYFTPRITCKDGFSISVQASHFHYCSPGEDTCFLYTSVEAGYPAEVEPLLIEYAEGGADDLTKDVYPYVPVEVIEEVINKHGGIK